MDIRTGEILSPEDLEKQQMDFDEMLIRVSIEEATLKQKKDKRVSLNDHRSKLGQRLTKERYDAGLTKNRLRKLRRQGKIQ